MLVSDSDVGQSVSLCWGVGWSTGVFLRDVYGWASELRDGLLALGS